MATEDQSVAATDSTATPAQAAPPDDARSAQLRELVADARVLLGHAVASSRVRGEKLVPDLTEVCSRLLLTISPGPPSAASLALEKRFLELYDQLTARAAPVTARSIRATAKVVQARYQWLTNFIIVVTLLVFAAVVFAQGYWVVGKRLRDQIQQQDAKKEELINKSFALGDNMWHVLQRRPPFGSFDCDVPASQPRSGANEFPAQEKAKRCALEASLDEELVRLQMAARPVERELKSVIDQTEPLMHVVAQWYTVANWPNRELQWWQEFAIDIKKVRDEAEARTKREIASIREAAARQAASAMATVLPLRTRSSPAGVTGSTGSPSGAPQTGATTVRESMITRRIDAETEAKVQAIEQRRSRILIQRVDINLDIVHAYLVPSLLGLLGALIFVLRERSLRLQDYSYLPDSAGRGVGRVVFGMMAGVMGGWFFPNADTLAKSVPPLLIPFAFGYSVELLFKILDKAVGALDPPKPASPVPSA